MLQYWICTILLATKASKFMEQNSGHDATLMQTLEFNHTQIMQWFPCPFPFQRRLLVLLGQ